MSVIQDGLKEFGFLSLADKAAVNIFLKQSGCAVQAQEKSGREYCMGQ